MAHAPFEQTAAPFGGTWHALPHRPQLATLTLTFTQAEEHTVVPAGHVLVHLPAEQACSVPHCTPQPPQ
jgi:hypothetical protein